MGIDDKEIEKLAKLSRIKITDAEKKKLSKDIENIFEYVSEIQEISSNLQDDNFLNSRFVNVMREDGEPHKSGIYTEKILKEAPDIEDNYIRVKKIL
ncbi:hypothetical protein COT82_00905 [Candidatus Campbellbacteria bacterium CG10_big_fil_rev_8_21_14_0_10_35_52]|uniref:Asp-tRNA(Asn)/Glu-tRNA(Gln) amidotransferase GatCAB subunit C n=1 Tax=Candidatus Campbellbacteria bacterium CG10_big_fil_rev_8_21_14_0_10_35_52 TaxID=1974527 RepID=A0A2M6WVP4_9BACT|nr:MAG: hypothetical protein COT82_00905 [Candidatus Campbellbacteria bacterium CG10_big_fil_rev_8_21_14_0_10_35_52]